MTTDKKLNKKVNQIVIDLDKALDDIIHQNIYIMQKVKALCPKDFTDNQISLVFTKTETLYSALLLKFYKDQIKKAKSPLVNVNDVSIV